MLAAHALPGYRDTLSAQPPSRGTDLRKQGECVQGGAGSRAPRPRIRVPQTLRDSTASALAVAVFAVLESRCQRRSRITITQNTIQAALGRRGRPDAISAATTELEEAGFLRTSRSSPDAPLTYRLIVRGGGQVKWDEISCDLVHALATGTCTPQILRTALAMDRLIGARGWTHRSPAEIAVSIGTSERTIQRHLSVLERLGEISRRITNGRQEISRGHGPQHLHTGKARSQDPASTSHVNSEWVPWEWWLEEPPLEEESLPEDDFGLPPAVEVLCGGAGDGEKASSEAVENAFAQHQGGDKKLGWSPTKNRALKEDAHRRPAHRLKNEVTSPEGRYLGDARERSGGQPPSKNRRIPPSSAPRTAHRRPRERTGMRGIVRSDVAAILRRVDRIWWDGPAARWRPGLGRLLADHLDNGVTADQLVTALTQYADPLDGWEPSDSGFEWATRPRRIRDAARAGINTMLTDLRLGLACIECGSPDVLRGSRLCGTHTKQNEFQDTVSVEAIPVEERLAAMVGLGMTIEQIRNIDPAAAERLASQPPAL